MNRPGLSAFDVRHDREKPAETEVTNRANSTCDPIKLAYTPLRRAAFDTEM